MVCSTHSFPREDGDECCNGYNCNQGPLFSCATLVVVGSSSILGRESVGNIDAIGGGVSVGIHDSGMRMIAISIGKVNCEDLERMNYLFIYRTELNINLSDECVR